MSNTTLKIIAIICMTIDHAGYLLAAHGNIQFASTEYYLMRGIGRLAFPIFLFLAIEGYKHTSNIKKYIIGLFIFAIISAYPFYYAFGSYFDVFFTLGTVVLMLYIFDNFGSNYFKILFFILFMFFAYKLSFDWGLPAIATIYLLQTIYKDKNKLIFYLPITLTLVTFIYYHCTSTNLFEIFKIENILYSFNYYKYFTLPILLTIPLLYFYSGKRGFKLVGFKKYLFYVYYPLHLIILKTMIFY